MTTTPSNLGAFAEVDVHPLSSLRVEVAAARPGTRLRFQEDLGPGGILDAALLRQHSDTLIVTFHGLLERYRTHIPRFERARTTEPFGTSCLYWADPSLALDPHLAIAWYTGVAALDLPAFIAERSIEVAHELNAKRLIFTGSSGGGFAALQVSAIVPGSTALVFNPQTAIFRYLTSFQRRYLKNCRPDALGGIDARDFEFAEDWSAPLDDRYSAVRRYSAPTQNTVVYHSNTLDSHDHTHRAPFEVASDKAQPGRLTVHTYEQEGGHQPPSPGRFSNALRAVLGA